MIDQLFGYQQFGSAWLREDWFRFLADEMGLGKSVQAITAKPPTARGLVICPANLRINWFREIKQWSGHHAFALSRYDQAPPRTVPWTVVSYEYALTNRAELEAVRYDVLVLDESHYVCRRDAARSNAIFGRSGDGGIARSVERVWWLTGTPILTSPADLWLPFRFSGHTQLSYDAWCAKFCFMTNRGREWVPTGLRPEPEVAEELRLLIKNSGFVLRRLKEDVLKDLPPLFYQHCEVEADLKAPDTIQSVGTLGMGQVELERRLVEHAMEGEEFKRDELAVLQGLAKSVTTLRRYLGLLKVAGAVQLVHDELSARAYGKILIACEYLDTLEAIGHQLSPWGVGVIRGETVPEARYAILDQFRDDPDLRVLLMQTRAGGVGINAIAADQVLVVECPWTPAQLQQLVARCHRIGQTRAVTARVLSLAHDPMDAAIIRLVVRRAKDIRLVLGDGGS